MSELRQQATQSQKETAETSNEDLHGATPQLHHVATPTGAGPPETARQTAELTTVRLLGKPAIEAALMIRDRSWSRHWRKAHLPENPSRHLLESRAADAAL